jgi:hypothetical protein
MSKNSLLLTSAAALLPTLAMGLVGISWSVANVPLSGLADITFPFFIANSPHETGYYNGQSDVGYTGLQPRPDSGGTPVIHAVFSSFVSGTTTTDGNCHSGADGGPGVSCAVEFSAPYKDAYQLVVLNTEGTTWNGTVVDTTTGESVHIGSWTLPDGAGGIKGSQVGFIEYYPWNDGQNHLCSTLPFVSMDFGAPTTTMSGATGSLGDAYEYGNCVGQVAFESHRTSDQEVEVSVGLRA